MRGLNNSLYKTPAVRFEKRPSSDHVMKRENTPDNDARLPHFESQKPERTIEYATMEISIKEQLILTENAAVESIGNTPQSSKEEFSKR